jgi:hypothetical protein
MKQPLPHTSKRAVGNGIAVKFFTSLYMEMSDQLRAPAPFVRKEAAGLDVAAKRNGAMLLSGIQTLV